MSPALWIKVEIWDETGKEHRRHWGQGRFGNHEAVSMRIGFWGDIGE